MTASTCSRRGPTKSRKTATPVSTAALVVRFRSASDRWLRTKRPSSRILPIARSGRMGSRLYTPAP